jgi:hypothetical protein
MKNKTIIGILAAMALAGCSEHEVPVDYSLKAGNIYCADGTVLPPSEYDSSMNGIGVVVKVGGEDDNYKAICVGRYDIGMYAFSDTLYKFSSVSTDLELYDGRENTAALIKEHMENPEITVPAATAVAAHSDCGVTGWHIPSAAELILLAKEKKAVKPSLEQIEGEWPYEKWYVSSTQDGRNSSTQVLYTYSVSLSEGRVKDTQKTEKHAVRPFIIIE